MQTSSPLAALQPQQPLFGVSHWNLTVDRPVSNPRPDAACRQSFNFNDLSMQKNVRPAAKDYFNIKPAAAAAAAAATSQAAHRTSSPAANLAIDMRQNLSIDRSPRFPTPRRTLFVQTNPLKVQSLDVHTPPASACPSLDVDMETSPLPHKSTFAATTAAAVQGAVQSPTPETTPIIDGDQMMTSPTDVAVASPVEPLRTERRRPMPMPISRPSLRCKSASSAQVPMSAGLTGQRPPLFNFGNSQRPLSYKPPTLADLDDAFGDSPGKDSSSTRSSIGSSGGSSGSSSSSIITCSSGGPSICSSISVPATANTTPLLLGARPRSANQIGRSLGSPWNGSPGGRLFPRPGAPAPMAKRRKSYRRANSVFDGSDRFAKTFMQSGSGGGNGSMSSIPEFDSAQDRKLPSFLNDASEERIRRITMNTLVDVLDGKYNEHYDEVKIVDCRFEYEYEGGHINGAINCTDKASFATSFYPPPANSTRTLIVFHCEYSAQRAPMTAHFFRDTDRSVNDSIEASLSYPEIYILDGGYSAFFKVHKRRCFPQRYIEMHDKNHIDACERGMDRINLKHRRKLSRAHTFALGEHRVQESPTAPQRGMSCQGSSSNIAAIVSIDMDTCQGTCSSPSLPTLGSLALPPLRSPLTMRSISY